MTGPDEKKQKDFPEEIGSKQRRKIKARREGDRSIWFGLGLMGTIGWAVAIPTLIGVAIGLWLDSLFADRVSWTLVFLFAGLIIGCLNAYYWAKRQMTGGNGKPDDE